MFGKSEEKKKKELAEWSVKKKKELAEWSVKKKKAN